MPSQDRKLLWGKSRGRCAICKKSLINTEDGDSRGVIVGHECHIIGHSRKGPRGESELPLDQRHKYENIVLLCTEHARTIDERPDHWTADRLIKLKKDHEDKLDDFYSAPKPINPKIRLIEFTGKSRGGPDGHFNKFTIRNFGEGEAVNISSWVAGWGFHANLIDLQNRSYLGEKETIEYELKVDQTPVYSGIIPFFKFYSSYDDLDGHKILYTTNLKQEPHRGYGYSTKIDGGNMYELIDNKLDFDEVILLDYAGGGAEAIFKIDSNQFRVKVSDSLLACWGISKEQEIYCLTDLAKANLKVMRALNIFEDKEYVTMTFPDDQLSGIQKFERDLNLIREGQA